MARTETQRGSGQTIRHGQTVWAAHVQLGDDAPSQHVRIVWGPGGTAVFIDGRKVNPRRRKEWERRLREYGVTAASVISAAAEGRNSVLASSPRPHTIVEAEE